MRLTNVLLQTCVWLCAQEAKPAAAPVPRKARPMPPPAEVRRQMLAYKLQVHELRLEYAKELQTKVQAQQEAKKAGAILAKKGILCCPSFCSSEVACTCSSPLRMSQRR